MALVLKIRVTEIDAPNYTFFNVEDENDTLDTAEQYGQGGNPARSTLGLFLFVTKKEVGDDDDSIVYALNDDPENVALWQIDYNEDNWFEHVLIAAIDWDVDEAGYVANDITYKSLKLWLGVAPVTGSIPGVVAGEWTEITSSNFADAVSNGTGNFEYNVTLDDGRLEISSVAYAKKIAESTKNGICLNCDHSNNEEKQLISLHLNAAQVAIDQQLFTQAQQNIVTLKKLTA